MFPIYRAKELAHHLGVSAEELHRIVRSPEQNYEPLRLIDPRKPDKERTVLSVRRPLSHLQSRFYKEVLLPSIPPSRFSHSAKGKSIKTNATAHLDSQFVYKTDISDFYPRIHDTRVYRMFNGRFECPPAVADLCSRLCTYQHHLALGLSTSPIIADFLLADVDKRIGAACDAAGLVYTRYVDDVTISGPYDLGRSGVAKLISRILNEHGFSAKKSKSVAASSDQTTITGIRIVRGRLDIAKEYAAELDRQLDDVASLAKDELFDGPYYTRQQIQGRVRFVSWVNPRRKKLLERKLCKINWGVAASHARHRGLIVSKKRVVPIVRPVS